MDGKRFRFRLLAGKHHEGGRTYDRGDVIETDNDLSVHNAPGAIKFELLGSSSSNNEEPRQQLRRRRRLRKSSDDGSDN